MHNIAAKKAARQTLEEMLGHLGHYLEMAAKGDGEKLARTGFDLRRVADRHVNDGTLAAPENLQLSHGIRSGEVDLNADSVPGASAYEAAIAQGDSTVEAKENTPSAAPAPDT